MKRGPVVERWLAEQMREKQGTARLVARTLSGDDPSSALAAQISNETRQSERRRLILFSRRLARVLREAGAISDRELHQLYLAAGAPDSATAARRLQRARTIYRDRPLAHSIIATCIVLNTACGVTTEEAASLQWQEFDLRSGALDGFPPLTPRVRSVVQAHQKTLADAGGKRWLVPALTQRSSEMVRQPEQPTTFITLNRMLLRAA